MDSEVIKNTTISIYLELSRWRCHLVLRFGPRFFKELFFIALLHGGDGDKKCLWHPIFCIRKPTNTAWMPEKLNCWRCKYMLHSPTKSRKQITEPDTSYCSAITVASLWCHTTKEVNKEVYSIPLKGVLKHVESSQTLPWIKTEGEANVTSATWCPIFTLFSP